MAFQPKITPEMVRDILLSRVGHRTAAKRHGVSYQAVSLIRHGKTQRNTLPEIPRWIPQTHACESCLHWAHGHCTMGFPEALENLRFANECNLFQKPSPGTKPGPIKNANESDF